jgi:hypothetical protein
MNKITTLILLFLTFYSCQNEQKKQLVHIETSEIENPEADKFFLSKFSKIITNTIEIYGIDSSLYNNEINSLSSESNYLDKQIQFKFDLFTDTCRYFIINSLYEVKEKKYIKSDWDALQSGIWKGLLNKTKKTDYTFFRNKKVNAIGDESEYSEIPVKSFDNHVMVIYQIRLGKYIIQYAQIINVKKKNELITKIIQNIRSIKSL